MRMRISEQLLHASFCCSQQKNRHTRFLCSHRADTMHRKVLFQSVRETVPAENVSSHSAGNSHIPAVFSLPDIPCRLPSVHLFWQSACNSVHSWHLRGYTAGFRQMKNYLRSKASSTLHYTGTNGLSVCFPPP